MQNEGCSRDFVAIYDGPYRRATDWLATYCGSGNPQKVRTTGNQMRIEFKTDQRHLQRIPRSLSEFRSTSRYKLQWHR